MPAGSGVGQLTTLLNSVGNLTSSSSANSSQTMILWVNKGSTWSSQPQSGVMTGMGGNLQPFGDHITWSDGNAYMGVFRDGTSGGGPNYTGTGGTNASTVLEHGTLPDNGLVHDGLRP